MTLQIPHQLEVVRSATAKVAKESIGSAVCKRAEELNAVAVVLAKRSRKGASVTDYCGFPSRPMQISNG